MCEANEYKNYLHLLNELNHYKILGVNENSSLDEITKSYRLLAKKLHPDMYISVDSVEKQKINQLFQIVTYSFNLLKDAAKRQDYNKELELKKSPNKVDIADINRPFSNINPNNDPRTKGGFTFTKLEAVDIDKIREEKDRKDKENAKINFEKSKTLIIEKKTDEAIAILRNLTDKFSTVAEYHSYLGLAMQEKGWHGYAQAEFKVALHFNPNDSISLKNYKPSAKAKEKEDIKQNEPNSVVGKFKSFFNRKQ